MQIRKNRWVAHSHILNSLQAAIAYWLAEDSENRAEAITEENDHHGHYYLNRDTGEVLSHGEVRDVWGPA